VCSPGAFEAIRSAASLPGVMGRRNGSTVAPGFLWPWSHGCGSIVVMWLRGRSQGLSLATVRFLEGRVFVYMALLFGSGLTRPPVENPLDRDLGWQRSFIKFGFEEKGESLANGGGGADVEKLHDIIAVEAGS